MKIDIIIKYFILKARNGSRALQGLSAEQRSEIIRDYADLLLKNKDAIVEANNRDMDLARKNSKN
jgi:gamma-glutamyl phosphate reductase